MNKLYFFLVSLFLIIFFSGCGSDSPGEVTVPIEPKITLDASNDYSYFADDKEGTVSFTSSQEWTVSGGASWLTISPQKGGAGKSTLSLSLTENKEPEEREAAFSILSGNIKQSVAITQKGKDAIILSPEIREVGAKGGMLELVVKSNIEFGIEIDADWIKRQETKSMVTHMLRFSIQENPIEEERTGHIKFYHVANPELAETITVKQEAKEKAPEVVTEDERAALMALYNSLKGSGWKNKTNWGSDKPVGEWYGITTELERVVSIDLTGNGLQGTIPKEIGDLKKLRYLLLSHNQLTGSIPKEIGNLTALVDLRLYATSNLSGSIPPEIGHLLHLETLVIEHNKLSGTLPVELGKLTNLWCLMLSNNNLEGNIPVEITQIPGLRQLALNNNRMAGEIPQQVQDYLWFIGWSPSINIYPQQKGYGLYIPEEEKHPLDGIVYTYVKSSKPRAATLVFMGDGFVAKDMGEGGKYYSVLARAADELLNVEPFKSYREYFTIYFVNAVSKEEGISSPEKRVNTVFGTVVNFGNSAGMNCNQELCYEYAEKTGITSDNGAILMVANTNAFGGSSGGLWRNGGFASVTYDATYINTVVHEMGHAFAFLADEYFVPGDEKFPQSAYAELNIAHASGKQLNVDYRNDAKTVAWSHFIGHPKYSMVGIYEGALWPKGLYRSEEVSCMVDNRLYFNAPSREAIVKRILSLAGETYSFERFVEKDIIEFKE